MSESALPPVPSEPALPAAPVDELQFLRAEPGTANSPAKAVGRACILCRQPIVSTYYALRDKVLCPACRVRVTAPLPGSEVGRVIKASFMGLGAGLVGALIWFAVRRAIHLEIGLVAILVGFMVGKAVRKGSGGRGGRGYQILAVVLTYFCIAANYMPDIVESLVKALHERHIVATDPGMIARLTIAVVERALEVPFLPGAENMIGLLIIGFALFEAWKFNLRRPLPISGPYQMAPRPAQSATVAIAAADAPGGISQ
jgi:hypothetical protein